MDRREWEVWDDEHVGRLVKEVWGDVNHRRGRHWELNSRVAKYVEKGDSVLEIAPGIGHLYGMIRDKVSNYVGLDTSEAMVAQFKFFFPDAEVRYGDAFNLQDEPVADVVLNVDMLMHIPGDVDLVIKPIIGQLWGRAKKRLVFTMRMTPDEKESWCIQRDYIPMPNEVADLKKKNMKLTIRAISQSEMKRVLGELQEAESYYEDYYDERTSIWVVNRR